MSASARWTMGRGKRREPPLFSFPFPSFPAGFHFSLSPASLRHKGGWAEEAAVGKEKTLKMKTLDLESRVNIRTRLNWLLSTLELGRETSSEMNWRRQEVRLKFEDLLKICGKEMRFKQTSDLSNASVKNYSATGFLISSKKCRAR